jgi:hypothetical protein
MEAGKKVALGVTVVMVLAIGVRVGLIYRERHEAATPVERASTWTVSDDDMVFLKKTRPSSLQDVKDLAGKPLWVSAGGQLDYYKYEGHKVDYAHSAGLILGADRLDIKDAVEAVAPKSATFRIPGGDRQVLFVFTKPGSTTEYAVPIGFREKGQYTFYVDEVFFYQDPHTLYNKWPAETWKAIDEHRAILGMNERQAMLALGQVSKSGSQDYGNRTVDYDHQGNPVSLTFEKDKAIYIR